MGSAGHDLWPPLICSLLKGATLVLFPIYAFLVWYACLRWRRQFMGIAALILGVALIALLAQADLAIRRALHLHDEGPLFRFMLYSEALIVTLVGAILVFLPPRAGAQHPCRRCGYELAGLEHANPTCPECGTAFAACKVELVPCVACGQQSPASPDGRNLCAACLPPAAVPAA